MKLTSDSLTAPVLVTTLSEELKKVDALFARGPNEPLLYRSYVKNELSAARKASIAATAPMIPEQSGQTR